jgi:lipopolysaccharide/colanic/teichoic acid biosynthesis glycosyltransferase
MDSTQSGSIASIETTATPPVQLEGSPSLNKSAGTIVLGPPPHAGPAAPEIPVERVHGILARATKRTIDFVGALLLIATLLPFVLVTAVLIKLDSPGPILFRQRRVGRDGKLFWMLKFRTMIDGADEQKPKLRHLNGAAEGLFKIDGDPRVTRLGTWLRGTSLDELPQLLHVLTGKMSLVGPRPLVPEEDALIIGTNRRRLVMRPGMTGVWQVNGASSIPINKMVVLDRGYVEGWSLRLDCRILLRTASHVFLRRGL